MHTHDSPDGASRRALTPPGRLVSVHVTLSTTSYSLKLTADKLQAQVQQALCVMQSAEIDLMRECTRLSCCACNELLTCIRAKWKAESKIATTKT